MSKKIDMVDHPPHYETGKFECIDVMCEAIGVEEVKAFCLCNAFKYIYRYKKKNNTYQDIEKAIWYLNKYLDLVDETGGPSEIQDILDYLDTELHPIVSPEHWNVYSELHDMISTLPSAQQWIPCSERLPKKERRTYWVCTDAGTQHECRWTNNRFGMTVSDKWGWSIFDTPQYTKVIAWMPLPEPYRAERRTDD